MALDVLQNYAEATVTTALNGTDAAGTSDTVTVSALSGAWVGLGTGQQMRVADKTDVNNGTGYEIMILTANNSGATGSWTLTRGAEGSTIKAHTANWTMVPVETAGGTANFVANNGIVTLIQRQVLGAAAATVTFSSIPQTCENLILVLAAATSDATTAVNAMLQFNGDATATNYKWETVTALGGSVSSAQGNGGIAVALLGAATSPGQTSSAKVTIPGYARSTLYKSAFGQCSSTNDNTNPSNADIFNRSVAGLWISAAAITSLSITDGGGGNFLANSVFSLYGEA